MENKNTKLSKARWVIALLLLASLSARSQTNSSGIYVNLADYQNHKLTYEINCSRETIEEIELFDFALTVTHEGQKYTHRKSDIYGFKDCGGSAYRFFNNGEYQIVETKDIIIYWHEANEALGKESNTVKEYYFSTTLDGEIKSLSVENLVRAFPRNHKFHDLLNQNLRNGEISKYDSFHEMYKLNHLYQMSKKTIARAF
jgi:hypothetical protein